MFGSLRSRYGSFDHGAVTWLVSHVAACMSRYKNRADGKAAYSRINGIKIKRPMVEFAECIWYFKKKDAQ